MSKEEKRRMDKEGLKKLSSIFSYVLPYKATFTLGLFVLLLSSSILMVFPYISGKLLDLALGKQVWFMTSIGQAALLLLAVLFFQAVASFFRVMLFAKVTENAMANIRTDLYEKMVRLPMSFFDRHRTGDLISRISNDVSILQSAMSTTLAELIRQIITLLAGVSFIFFISWKLSVFMLAIFPVIVIAAIIFGKKIKKLSKSTQEELANTNVIVEETLQSILSVKSFTSENFEITRYKSSMASVVNKALKVAGFRGAFISFIIFAVFGAITGVMWYGATLLQTGMDPGNFVSFLMYTGFIGASIAGLGDLFGQLQRAVGASERVLDVLKESTEEEIVLGKETEVKGDIVFKDVTFEYPTRQEMPVLKGVNLEVKNGQKVALVGHSGAGKSTIAQLLMGFYQVSGGEVTIGDKLMKDLDLESLRAEVGVVPQEVLLFGGSIEENIRYGKEGASKEEVIEAARRANALDFIESFPEGFDTLVGERGVKLSGGQRQRIAIARAVLKNPSILILDEATSSLDAESEHLVQQALNELMQDRTTLIIAHRLSTIKSCDLIYVLDEGQVVEFGTHQFLIQTGGAYKNFVNLQMMEG